MTKRKAKPQTQPLPYVPGQRIGCMTLLSRCKVGEYPDGSVRWNVVCNDCNRARQMRANNLNRKPPVCSKWCDRGEPYNGH